MVGHGRAGQFLLRFLFAVSCSRPQMGLNSCHRDPEVLVQVDQGCSAVGARGLGDPRVSLVHIRPVCQFNAMIFLR